MFYTEQLYSIIPTLFPCFSSKSLPLTEPLDGPYADECLKVYEDTKQYQISLCGLRSLADAFYNLLLTTS